MHYDQERPRRGQPRSVNSRVMEVMIKVATVTAGVILLVSALVLSVVFVLGAVAVLLVVGGYFWWKTREVRKQMRAQMRPPFAQGNVIEGVVVRDVVADDTPEHRR